MAFDDLIHGQRGWREGDDRSTRATAYVLGYDAATRQVTVSGTEDGEGTDVPAVVDCDWSAVIGGTCWVLRDPSAGVTTYALAPVIYPVAEEDPEPVPPSRAQVTGVSGSTITILRSDGVADTALALASYTSPAVNDQVWLSWAPDLASCAVVARIGTPPSIPGAPASMSVSRDGGTLSASWPAVSGATRYEVSRRVGSGAWSAWSSRGTATTWSTSISQGTTVRLRVRAVNAAGSSSARESSDVTWPAPAPKPPQLVTRTATIFPIDTGTYRVSSGKWGDWNAGRYGGVSTLYQGSAHGSGQLVGAAFYGSRVRDLGAVTITSMRVLLRGADLGERTHPPITLIGTYQSSRPGGGPSGAGATFGGNPGKSGTAWAWISGADFEAWRVGVLGGFALVGGGYGAVRGLSAPDGMALHIEYQVYA